MSAPADLLAHLREEAAIIAVPAVSNNSEIGKKLNGLRAKRGALYTAAADEIERLRRAQGWQPIETAPKYGWVIGFNNNPKERWKWPRPMIRRSDIEGSPWCLNERGQPRYEFYPPTLWHPLPEPPQ